MAEPNPLPQPDVCSRPELDAYCARVRAMVSEDRFQHILRVARLATAIASTNHFTAPEVDAVRLAAVLHDAARDLSPEELFELAPPQNPTEERHPLSVHGRAARVIAERWGVHDADVLEAVEGHVFGVAPGNRVGVAVYIADVCEPGRGVNDDIRTLALSDLDTAYARAVESKVTYLRSQGKAVHPATLRVYEQLAHRT
jgi:predicted HD superfamily hydrolase involved in NAD metabolism